MPAASYLVPAGMSILGGLLGGQGNTTQKMPQTTNQSGMQNSSGSSFTQNSIDPRMEPYIYGNGGVLSRANSLYQANPSGLNDQMLQGMNSQWNQLGASKQGYDQMQNLGMGLMGGGAAGNPFTGSGGIAPSNMTFKPATLGAGSSVIDPFKAMAMPAPVDMGGYGGYGGGGGGGSGYDGGGDGSGQAPTAASSAQGEPFNPLGYIDEDGNWVNKTRVGSSRQTPWSGGNNFADTSGNYSGAGFGGYDGYNSASGAWGGGGGGE